jgi:hypothetical protein
MKESLLVWFHDSIFFLIDGFSSVDSINKLNFDHTNWSIRFLLKNKIGPSIYCV